MTKSSVPDWPELQKLRRSLEKQLQHDRFFKKVLSGCFRVAQDKKNLLRGNFMASGLREAISHVLHSLAPDEAVRACTWFVQAKDTPTVTRQQRAKYIVQAGLSDHFVIDVIKVNLREHTTPLIATMDGLNKSTHVRPETILTNSAKIREMVRDVLLGIDQLLQAATNSRKAVTRAIADVMHEAVFEKLISETIQELDELSTHTTVDEHWIDEVEVTKLDWVEISYCITGMVEVELQYGSNSDVNSDFGYRQDASYPYIATVTCSVTAPMAVRADDLDVVVDNESFYK